MTAFPWQGVTHACFGLSYLCAFGLELARLAWPRPGLRVVALGFGAAGLLAQSIYLAYHQPAPAAPYGSVLLVAWVLAVFYLWGSVHHRNRAWAVFVLPLLLGLVGLSFALLGGAADESAGWLNGDTVRVGGAVHGVLVLAAAVGVSVAFLASVMYLLQARRLRNKQNPLGGVRMLSLEKLETMNRRAVNVAFPLLTAGLFVGTVLLKQYHGLAENWFSLKVLSTAGLWVAFLLLLYLRYGAHVPGRRLATLSIAAFALMLVALAAAHPFATGGDAR